VKGEERRGKGNTLNLNQTLKNAVQSNTQNLLLPNTVT
jgi:hypothetical protein